MVRPDYRAVDHVGGNIALDHGGERLQHGFEHTRPNPAAIPPEHAVPLAVPVWQMPPLRARPRHPHHAFKIWPVFARGAAASPPLRGQQWTDQRPLIIGNPDPLAQRRLQKDSLESTVQTRVNLCPRYLVNDRLRKLLGAVNVGHAFQLANVTYLSTIGFALLGSQLVALLQRVATQQVVGVGASDAGAHIDLKAYVAVAVIFVLAEVFRQGTQLQDDAAMTV